MNGPFVVICRGHSGGRILSEAFVHNGIQMGEISPRTKDTLYLAPARNPLIRELTLVAYEYSEVEERHKLRLQSDMRRVIEDYVAKQIMDRDRPFGWKLGVSLYLAPLLLDSIPTAKVVHVIRDGRDVMLSRLGDTRFKNLSVDTLHKMLVFGDKEIGTFKGVPLDLLDVESVRTELEMTHWVTSVRFGLKLRPYTGRYQEVRYEDICRRPIESFDEIFAFLNVPFRRKARKWLDASIHTNRIGKWKKYPAEQLSEPLRIGASLLQELGYKD